MLCNGMIDMELIDFHAHILPHMDHGSANTQTAKAQLAILEAAGVATVCATSHFYPQTTNPADYLDSRRQSLEHLLHAMMNVPRPQIILGAEVLICKGLENMEGLHGLCLEGTNVMLLEMPFTNDTWDTELFRTVREIRALGIHPVLAHVDRYPRHAIEALFDMGLDAQINTHSLVGLFKPKHLIRWIDDGHIVALGGDLHGCDPKAYESFRKVCHAMPDRVERIMQETGRLLGAAKRY